MENENKEELIAHYLYEVSHDLAIYFHRRVGPRTEELMSEVTVLAYEKINKLAHRSYDEFSYWAFNVARKKTLEWYRKGKIPETSLDDLLSFERNQLIADTDDPLEALLHKEEKEQVVHALGRLKKEDKLIYRERYSEGLTFREIAERHDCPLNTVRARHRRFLIKLRIMLDNKK